MIMNIDYDAMDAWIDTKKIDYVGTLRKSKSTIFSKDTEANVVHNFFIGVGGSEVNIAKIMVCSVDEQEDLFNQPFENELITLREVLISELKSRGRS